MTNTPQTVRRRATIVAMVSAPLVLATPVAWIVGWLPHDPAAVVMVFSVFLFTCMGALIVAAVAMGQIAVAASFAAGLQIGATLETRRRIANGKHLRSVE
jgi:hypothetical protein